MCHFWDYLLSEKQDIEFHLVGIVRAGVMYSIPANQLHLV